MAINWRTYQKDTIATRLSRAELPGFFRKQIAVGPGEAAVVLKGGAVEQVITESNAKVANLWDKVLSWLGLAKDLEVIFVDISPFDFPIFLGKRTTADRGATRQSTQISRESRSTLAEDAADVALVALSRDGEAMTAECQVRARVCLEEAARITALLRGRDSLAVWDLAAMVRSQLVGPVLQPLIAAHRSAEFRAGQGIGDQLASQARQKLIEGLAAWGITLDSFTIAWGLTEAEVAQMAQNRNQREEDARDFQHHRVVQELERQQDMEKNRLANLQKMMELEHELQKARQINAQELKVGGVRGENELKDLQLAAEIHRALMVEGGKVDIARTQAEIRKIQSDIEDRDARLRLERWRDEEQARLDIRRREQLQQIEADERQWRLEHEKANAEILLEDKELQGLVNLRNQMSQEDDRLEEAQHRRQMERHRVDLDMELRRREMDLQDEYSRRKLDLEERLRQVGVMQGLMEKATDPAVQIEIARQMTEQRFAAGSDAKVQARAQAEAAKNNLNLYERAQDRERAHQGDMIRQAADLMQAAKPGTTPPHCPKCGRVVQEDWNVCPRCRTALRN